MSNTFLYFIVASMNDLERDIEQHLIWAIALVGGKTYKFKSVSQSGVADRIVCFPNGETWFVEIKQAKGKLSKLQEIFAAEVIALQQKYICLWSKEQVTQWVETQFN